MNQTRIVHDIPFHFFKIILKLSSRLLLLLELLHDIQIFHSAEHGAELNVQNVTVFFFFRQALYFSRPENFSNQWTCCSLLNPAHASDRLSLPVQNPQNCTTLAQRIPSHSSNLHLTIEEAPQAAANASGNFRSVTTPEVT